jgi:hypothetical protein
MYLTLGTVLKFYPYLFSLYISSLFIIELTFEQKIGKLIDCFELYI